MKFHQVATGNTRIFTACSTDHVMVNGKRYDHSIVVSPEMVHEDWDVASFDELDEQHFSYFLTMRPDVLLLGTGTKQHFPHPRLYRRLIDAGISVECMDTPAACRTYNILAAEDRKVVAAILI